MSVDSAYVTILHGIRPDGPFLLPLGADSLPYDEAESIFVGELMNTRRKGIQKLIEVLKTRTDFFDAPAAISGVGACQHGLLYHSLSVFFTMMELICTWFSNLPDPQKPSDAEFDKMVDSTRISALLHGVGLINKFNVAENGSYIERTDDEAMLYEPGWGAALVASQYIPLSKEESCAICYVGDTSQRAADIRGRFRIASFLKLADDMSVNIYKC